MSARLWNWRLWAGFALALIALLAYSLLFLTTREVFWPCLVLSIIAAFLLVSGTRRAFTQPDVYRGKIAAPIFCSLVLVIFAAFGLASFAVFKNFPVARRAPKVGQPAPQFTLVDSAGKDVSLAELLSEPINYPSGMPSAPKGVLVVF